MATPEHGTLYRRKNRNCKCDLCADVSRVYERKVTRLKAYGRWDPLADAEPVREHVKALQSAGVGLRRIAALSGISLRTVTRLVYGAPADGRGPTKRVTHETAAALLAVQPGLDSLAPNAVVDGTGTSRRLQALMCIGWPITVLARMAGIDQLTARSCLGEGRVFAKTARAVRELYERLWDQPPAAGDRYAKASATKARTYAAARGWAPPMAWDEEAIDDPDAKPVGAGAEPRRGKLPPGEDLMWLIQGGDSMEAIAGRFGSTPESVRQSLFRARKAASS